MRVLVVEDDLRTQMLLRRGLEREGHEVHTAEGAAETLADLENNDNNYEAIILDANLPDVDGFELCRSIRQQQIWTPVLMLTGRSSIDDRVRGLDAGADDYLTKPFAFTELFARLRAVTRRNGSRHTLQLRCGDVSVDPMTRKVRRGDVPVHLSPRELALLVELMRHPGQPLTREELRTRVWEEESDPDPASNVVDVYVRYLRERLDRPFGRRSIQTVRGVGYKMVDDRPVDDRIQSEPYSSAGLH